MGDNSITILFPVKVINFFIHTFIQQLNPLTLKCFDILKDIGKVQPKRLRVLNRKNPLNILPDPKIDAQQILNINNIKGDNSQNSATQGQQLLLPPNQANPMINTVTKQVPQRFDLLQCGLRWLVLVESQELALLALGPDEGLVGYHVRDEGLEQGG